MVAIILFLRFRSSQLCYKLELNYHIPDQLYQNLCGWDPDIAFGKALQIIPCVVKVENHCSIHPKKTFLGTSLVVQWLRLHVSNAGGVRLIPLQGTKIPHGMQCGRKKQNKTKQLSLTLS